MTDQGKQGKKDVSVSDLTQPMHTATELYTDQCCSKATRACMYRLSLHYTELEWMNTGMSVGLEL